LLFKKMLSPFQNKKFLWWTAGILGVICILAGALTYSAGRYVNTPAFKENIRQTASAGLHGSVNFDQLEISFFLKPRIVAHQLQFTTSKASGTIPLLTVYPAIWPLLTGHFRLSEIHAAQPDISLTAGPKKAPAVKTGGRASFISIRKQALSFLDRLSAVVPNLTIEIENGRVSVFEHQQNIFRFEDLNAKIDLDTGAGEVSCRSNLFDALKFKGRIPLHDKTGRARIELKGFRPHLPAHFLVPDASRIVSDSLVDLKFQVTSADLKSVKARFQTGISRLELAAPNQKIHINGGRLEGECLIHENRTTVRLDRLDLEEPQISLTGRFIHNTSPDNPSTNLEISGRNANLLSLNQITRALFGHFRPVEIVCDIVQGGTAESFTYSVSGRSISDLKELDLTKVEASVADTRIRIPKIGWIVEDVSGDVLISNGILEGRRLVGSLDRSRTYDSTLRMGLRGKNAPFHLDLQLDADINRLPELLRRILKGKRSQQVLRRIKDVKGKASGRLVLGERLNRIRPRVEVSDMKLVGITDWTPWPLEIDGGKLTYEGTALALQDIRAALKGSTAVGMNVRVDWTALPRLDIQCGKAGIDLDKVYPWITSLTPKTRLTESVNALGGFVNLSHLMLKGPIQRPGQWDYDAGGTIRQLTAELDPFNGPVTLTGGMFNVDSKRITLSDSTVDLLDADLSVSGALTGYRTGIASGELTLQGDIGSQTVRWLADNTSSPYVSRLKAPVSIERARVTWKREGPLSLSVDLARSDGAKLSGSLTAKGDELELKHAVLEDDVSRATMTLTRSPRKVDLTFNGTLKKASLEKFILHPPVIQDWIQGDFTAHILPGTPLESSLTGRFQGKDIDLSFSGIPPVFIRHIDLDSKKNQTLISAVDLDWADSPLHAEGSVNWDPDAFRFDLDVNSSDLDLNNFLKHRKASFPSPAVGERRLIPSSIPVLGVLNLRTDRFHYNRYTWKKFQATVVLNKEKTLITVKKADLCGINTTGVFTISGGSIRMDIQPEAEKAPLTTLASCLLDNRIRIDGSFNTSGVIHSQGKPDELTGALNGQVKFTAENGRIYHLGLLAKILSIINITEILAGKAPDLTKEGFGYDAIQARATLKNGTCIIDELVIHGTSMKIACLGSVDIQTLKANLTVMVAPLKTVDRLIEKIPLVGDVLGGSLLSIPVQVTGTLNDPVIVPLSPVTVGSRVLEFVKRVFQVPVKIIQPLLPAPEGQ